MLMFAAGLGIYQIGEFTLGPEQMKCPTRTSKAGHLIRHLKKGVRISTISSVIKSIGLCILCMASDMSLGISLANHLGASLHGTGKVEAEASHSD